MFCEKEKKMSLNLEKQKKISSDMSRFVELSLSLWETKSD